MDYQPIKRNLSRLLPALTRPARFILRNRFALAIASLIWLIWRSGTQPRRLGYPCQQAAAANLGFLAVLFIPPLARRRRLVEATASQQFMRTASGSIMLAGTLFVLLSGGVTAYVTIANYGGTQALIAWDRLDATDFAEPESLSDVITHPNGATAVVAINRNDSVTYGTSPYGPGDNTAYNLVWQTVADLHLGPWENPLADLVEDINNDGQTTVILKPNWVEYYTVRSGGEGDAEGRSPAYTHPAMMRPLVDMAITAGATEIIIGDSSGNPLNPNTGVMGYDELLTQLQSIYPNVSIQLVNLQNKDHFSWVDVDTASAYENSGYSSADLRKANTNDTYFNVTDVHGKTGPTNANCMGWYALTDYLLDADVIINMPKLKVHFMGVNTMALKNWVGTTQLSTFDNHSNIGGCRISHELNNAPSNYYRIWGDDSMWREVLDLHRSFLYWQRNADPSTGGTIQTTQQRRYLSVLDAIVAGETDLYFNGGPRHYRLNTVTASVDPIALDVVATRLQRYKFDHIPIVNNANQATNHPIGTGDPGKVRVVGSTPINATTFNRISDFDDNYDSARNWSDWSEATLNDITPPVFNSATSTSQGVDRWLVQANVQNAHVVFFYYGTAKNGAPNVARLARDGDTFSAELFGNAGNGTFVAQDEYFNTANADVINAPSLHVAEAALDQTEHIGNPMPDQTLTITNVGIGMMDVAIWAYDDWISFDTTEAVIDNVTTLEVTVSYDVSGLLAGRHTSSIVVASVAATGQKIIPVTIDITTVSPDFDGDGDVDQEDFGHLQACRTASVEGPTESCRNADLDENLFVNDEDVDTLKGCMSGATVLADPTCDDS